MWASNDENGSRPDQSMFFVPGKPPVGESSRSRGDGNIEKNCGGTVGESLRARPGSLRCGHESHDAG